MEANLKRTITNMESEINIKEGAFKEMTQQLKRLAEDNETLEDQLKEVKKKEKVASDTLAKKEQEF